MSFVLTAQFVLINVVVAVLMKHLDDSNKEAQEEAEMDAEIELELAQGALCCMGGGGAGGAGGGAGGGKRGGDGEKQGCGGSGGSSGAAPHSPGEHKSNSSNKLYSPVQVGHRGRDGQMIGTTEWMSGDYCLDGWVKRDSRWLDTYMGHE